MATIRLGGTGNVVHALHAIPKTYKSKTISNLTFSVNEEYKHGVTGGQGQPSLQEVGGQAVLGRQDASPTPWLTERHGYDPTWNWECCTCATCNS